MPFSHTDLKLLDPASGQFCDVDYGNFNQGLLLLNILLELRVHTMYMASMNQNIVLDTPEQMRLDACSDPSSLTSFNATSN